MIDERDKCPSCNIQYIEHVGIIGTCADLREAIGLIKATLAALDLYGIDEDDIHVGLRDFLAKVGDK